MDRKQDLLEARFHINMKRIAGLTALTVPSASPPAAVTVESEDVRADLFRAVVVFLHATFEDCLRTAARQRLGDATPEVLKSIPLVGTLGRAEKFHLGSLDAHRGKTVDQLIRESVEDHLTRESFGSCADVDKILSQMELDTKPFKSLYADLDGMMKRRHRIVHEADLPSPHDSSPPSWTFADYFQLFFWNLAVLAFYALLRISLDPADELQRWYFERRTRAIQLAGQTRNEIIVLLNQPVESLKSGLRQVETLVQQVAALLGPPSQEDFLALAERMTAK